MQGEIARLYYEYYRFAFDTARKAERTMKQELMRPEVDATDYIKFNYWDGGRKGLLCGEALYLDIKRMEMAYHENNKREFELTRHISLRQLDPLALLSLKVTGTCEVTIPEVVLRPRLPWTLYAPHQECRGLHPVGGGALHQRQLHAHAAAEQCPQVAAAEKRQYYPYTRPGNADDDRFVDYFGAMQSIVTSGGSNDSGMFETNLRDERFLPFEGAGAISTWRLELPKDFRPFDYMTISDVILHMRYTARQAGDLLGGQALTELHEMLEKGDQPQLALLFSLPHDFPTEWSTFINGTGNFTMRLRLDHFPYMVQHKKLAIDELVLCAQKFTQQGRSPCSTR